LPRATPGPGRASSFPELHTWAVRVRRGWYRL